MDCRMCREQLPDYADRALCAEEMRRLRSHLDTCAPCRAHLAAEEALEALLTAAPLRQPPVGFTAAVLARVQPQPRPSTALAWLPTLAAVLSTAAVAMGLRRVLHLLPRAAWPATWLRPDIPALPAWPWTHVAETSQAAAWLAAAVLALTLTALWSAWSALKRA